MAMEQILNIMASSASAESIRMNVSASNVANAGNIGSSDKETYHARHPVFAQVQSEVAGMIDAEQPLGGVRVIDVIQGSKPLNWRLDPDNPLADENGRVYLTDVNPIEEMADMISASRQYQASIDMMNTTKSLIMQTLKAIGNY
jgi:flagellar basal-body rod protein FlgC